MEININKWNNYWDQLNWLPDSLILTNKEATIIKFQNINNSLTKVIKENKTFDALLSSLNNTINGETKFSINIANNSYSIEKLKHPELLKQELYIWRITEHSYSIAEIEKSKILDSITDSAALITKDFKIKYANKAFKERFNTNTEKTDTLPCYKIMYNMDHPCIACSLKRVIKNKKPHRNTRSQKNGPVILSLTFPVFDKINEVQSGVVTFRDITASKNIEKALKKEATINKAIAEISRAIIMPELPEDKIANKILSVALLLTKSSTGYVASVNQKDKTMSWKAFEDFSLTSSQMANNEPCRSDTKIKCLFNKLKKHQETFVSHRLKEYLKEHNLITCNITRENCLLVPAIYNDTILGQIYVSGGERPYSEHDNEFLKQLANIYAITLYRKYSEVDLINARDEAEENNKLKSAFLANMSHEIRTPMNSINGFSELLRNTEQPSYLQKKYVDVIYKSSNQLLAIIDNILDISKLEVGQVSILEKEYDLNQIINDSISSFNPDLYLESPIELKTYLPIKGHESIISCDAPRLQQVLANLIQNAIKFTPKGVIEIGYDLNNDNKLQFYVKDTGIGISNDKKKIIFERFGQAEQGDVRNYKGAGLGLPICKGFIELMGGEIWVESEFGNGSIFYFTVPYKPVAKNINTARLKPKETSYNWISKKILLVEDETFSQNFMQTILLPYGPKIIYAEDGFKAIEQVKHNPDIDLILMDIRLPKLDGIDATIRIRENGFTKPILAQTANAMPNDREKCMDAGCNDFIVKPISRLGFLKIIDNFI